MNQPGKNTNPNKDLRIRVTEDEEQLLSGALSFERKTITSVLLPMHKLITVPATASPQQIEDVAASTGHSRFPITGNKGQLQGYVHLKDLLAITPAKQNLTLALKLIRDLPEIRANTSLRNALFTMQKQGAHLAKVIDPKQRTLGIVALEDVLEELVGHIRDDA